MPSPVRLCLTWLPPLALAAAALHPSAAQAQIRRCTDARGNSVYTDRDCATVGGVDRLPRGAAAAAAAKPEAAYAGGCARNLRDLVGAITTAIDAHDGNKLAAVYHFAGMSDDQGYAVIQRLDAIAQRPLLDIAPVMGAAAEPAPQPGPWTTLPAAAPNAALAPLPPATPPPPPAPATGLGRPAGMDGAAADASASAEAPATPAPVHRRAAPVALRLEQTLANGVTPSRTVFGLTRHFGCWWIKGG